VETFVMKVGYGGWYRAGLVVFAILIMVPQVFFFTKIHFWLPLLMVGCSSVMLLMVAVKCGRATYFEVYDNHLLLLSPLTRRLRWKRPIGSGRVSRWVAKREDFAKFEQWRQERGVM
jgi:hypothetical protein